MKIRFSAICLVLFAWSVPAFAQVDSAIATVKEHFIQNEALYGASAADLADLVVTDAYTSRRTNATYVYMRQAHNGIEVYNATAQAAVTAGNDVVAPHARFVSDLANRVNADSPATSPEGAASSAARYLRSIASSWWVENGAATDGPASVQIDSDYFVFVPEATELVYYALDNGDVRLAWDIALDTQDKQHYFTVRVDAVNGRVLDYGDQFVYENWGTLSGRSLENVPNYAPINSNAGVGAPASSLGWHDDGTTARTTTQGNNAHAYTDTNADKVPDPRSSPDGGGALIFDFPIDLLMDPSTYQPAAVMAPTALVGSYRAFQLPVESPDHASPPLPADGRVLHVNPDDATASPFGWHDTDGLPGAESTLTTGNNVDAHKGSTRPDGGGSLIFDNPADFSMSPITFVPAAITNAFYLSNIFHDITYQYGFDEVSGNFQENNYGNGGAGSDGINANVQASGNCNANFGTPPDGSNPTMNMYLCTTPNPDGDTDFDAGVLFHEISHGISNRLTGGPAASGCLQNDEQMGEGWGDWYGLSLTMEVGDARSDTRGLATYSLTNQGPNGGGIRLRPYDTDFADNDYTYGRTAPMTQVHQIGFVWATILWEVLWDMVDTHGFSPDFYNASGTAGNLIMLNLVTEGMKLQPCLPGFVDGRDAILEADQLLYGGDNTVLLWAAFARRGLGLFADQGSSGTNTDNTEDFTVPGVEPFPILDPTSVTRNVPEGQTADAIINLGNAGESELTWSLSAPPSWLSYSESSGSVPAFGNVDLTITLDASGFTLGDIEGTTVTMSTNAPGPEAMIDIDVEMRVTAMPTANEGGMDFPGTHLLSEVYPNPFNPTTTFTLAVADPQDVQIALFDILGRQIALLNNGPLAGRTNYQFTIDGRGLTSGTYFVRIAGETFADSHRITLLK